MGAQAAARRNEKMYRLGVHTWGDGSDEPTWGDAKNTAAEVKKL